MFSRAPDLSDPASAAAVWLFPKSATAWMQVNSAILTVEAVRFEATVVAAEVKRRWEDAGQKTRWVHDWRVCREYDAAARAGLIEWGKSGSPTTRETLLALSPNLPSFMRIAVGTGVSVMRLARMKIELVDDVLPLIAELNAEG